MKRDKMSVLTIMIIAVVVITMLLTMVDAGYTTLLIIQMAGSILTLLFVIGVILALFGKKKNGGQNKGQWKPTGTPSFRPDSKDHAHITKASFGHDKSHELQQLDTMLEAGLITNEEYRERLNRLKNQAQNQGQQRR